MIRLMASDIDGTLLPGGGAISPRTRAAVRACAERGVTFAIATGRWYTTARRIAEALGQTEGCMVIANGGAVVRMDGTPVHEWGMPREDAARVFEIARRYPVDLVSCTREALYSLNMQRPEAGREESRPDESGRFWYIRGDAAAFEREGLRAPYKMAVDSEDVDALAEMRQELEAAGLAVSSSYIYNLEIMSKGMGKGTAVRWLAESLGVAREETMAFGDNTNDLDMLNAVGWPVAMGNAVEELKAAARIIAPKDVDDGVAQIVERALRGEIG